MQAMGRHLARRRRPDLARLLVCFIANNAGRPVKARFTGMVELVVVVEGGGSLTSSVTMASVEITEIPDYRSGC